ncbi:hypothetical protein [Ekhidna sp.]|uniref:hypothetical protein n=1 Tax=Ekhidna sp. TaxID=2608089 RepID=UPI003296ADF0
MEELKRKKKVINMMITMHSSLRDAYGGKARAIDLILLILAVILNSILFSSNEYLSSITSFSPSQIELFTKILALLVFLISVILLLVNWKQSLENHKSACNRLFMLLNECRQLIEESGESPQTETFNKKYEEVMASIVPIPDAKFNRLKSHHLRKVEFSKYLDRNKAKPFWLCKLDFFIKSFNASNN